MKRTITAGGSMPPKGYQKPITAPEPDPRMLLRIIEGQAQQLGGTIDAFMRSFGLKTIYDLKPDSAQALIEVLSKAGALADGIRLMREKHPEHCRKEHMVEVPQVLNGVPMLGRPRRRNATPYLDERPWSTTYRPPRR